MKELIDFLEERENHCDDEPHYHEHGEIKKHYHHSVEDHDKLENQFSSKFKDTRKNMLDAQ